MTDKLLFQINAVKGCLLDAKLKNNQLEIKRLETKLDLLMSKYDET